MLFHNKYRTESSRCPKWDYSSPGYYFITMVTHDRRHLFGVIADGVMHLNDFGEIATDEWRKTGEIRDGIVLDEFIVMPNHIHGIIRILNSRNNDRDPKLGNHDSPGCRDVARYVSTTTTVSTMPMGGTDTGIESFEPDSINAINNIDNSALLLKSPIQITMSSISPIPESLSSIVRSFKSAITRRVNILRNIPGATVFQPRFHDHIIRDEKELFRIRQYIRNNPANLVGR